jgi:hypothetical protein
MGSPARRLTNPITRCWAQPNYGYAGTDDRRGTGPKRFAGHEFGVQVATDGSAELIDAPKGIEISLSTG